MKQQVSHLFQIQLQETHLSKNQVDRLASAIRGATAKELLKMDFRIEDLTPIFTRTASGQGCGGGCRAGTEVERRRPTKVKS